MFRKMLGLVLAAVMVFVLAACGQAPAKNDGASAPSESIVSSEAPETQPSDFSTDETSAPADGEQTEPTDGKTLVVYFSWSGNTEEMASYIADHVGGDLLEIEPKTAYPADYNECGDVAKAERDENARPEIANLPDSVDAYDTILVGYPNWNADMPYIMYSFFESYDFSGKTIVPFVTHGGSGFSGTEGTIADLEPDATMLDGKDISRNRIEDAEQEIIDWIDEIGLLKKN